MNRRHFINCVAMALAGRDAFRLILRKLSSKANVAHVPVPNALTAQQMMIIDAFNSQIYRSNKVDVQHTPLYTE